MDEFDGGNQYVCARCGPVGDDVEEANGFLVCPNCGVALQEAVLVHQNHTASQPTGYIVAAQDSGIGAAAGMLQGSGGRGAYQSSTFRRHKQLLDSMAGVISSMQLPLAVATSAKHLLSEALRVYTEAKTRVRPATLMLAAVVYCAARDNGVAVTLGQVGSRFSLPGVAVGGEYLRMIRLLQRTCPPPALRAMVLRHAAALLPVYFPAYQGALRQHALVKNALDLADLLEGMGKTDAASPTTVAAAIVKMALVAYSADAPNQVVAADVANVLGCNRHAMQQMSSVFELELLRLVRLLPFVAEASAQDVASHAGVMLRLHQVSLRAQQGDDEQQKSPEALDPQAASLLADLGHTGLDFSVLSAVEGDQAAADAPDEQCDADMDDSKASS